MQFRILHLLAAMAWLAVVFTLHRLHPAAALLVCPVTFGPLGGFVVAKSVEGAILGFVSAVFWCILLSFLGGIVLLGFLALLGAHGSPDQIPLSLFLVCFVYLAGCSLLGGYIGGRIAIW